MTDRDVVAERERYPGIGMQHRIVLDVGVVADDDRVIVTAQHRVPPDRGVSAEADIADYGCGGRDPVRAGELRGFVADGVDGHGISLMWRFCRKGVQVGEGTNRTYFSSYEGAV